MREAIQGVEVHFSGVGFPEPERSFALIQMCSESAASSASVLACLCFPPRSRKDLIPHASHALVPAVGLSSTWSFGILEFGVSVGGGGFTSCLLAGRGLGLEQFRAHSIWSSRRIYQSPLSSPLSRRLATDGLRNEVREPKQRSSHVFGWSSSFWL